jgi:hypothetical protein
LAAALAAGCGAGGDVLAPPPGKYFGATTEPPPALPLTVVDAPLLVDLKGAIELLEEALPRTYGDIEKRRTIKGKGRSAFAFELKREPFKVTVKRDTFQIASTIHYQGRGWYNPPIAPEIGGSCGTSGDQPRARIVISIRPSIDRDWRLIAKPWLSQLRPLTRTERDQCEVTFLKLDVTGKVLEAAGGALRKQLPKIAAKLATLNVRSEIEKIWNEIQKPIKLTDSVWLMLQPQGIRLGELSGSGEMVGGTVGISATPKIESGPEPPYALKPLPPLDAAAPSTGLNLLVEARFEYPLISSSLTSELRGREVKTPGGVLVLREIGVYGIGGGRVALGVRFGGTAAGQIYFVGTPQYDDSTGRVMVPDLEYDASTTPLLVKGLAWLKADEIRDYLRSQATFPSADAMEQLADLAVQGMNRQLTLGVFLTASLNRTEVLRIAPRSDALYLQAHAEGQAALHVTDDFFEKVGRDAGLDSSRTSVSGSDTSSPAAAGKTASRPQ